jgi:hypothetical protein
MGMWWEIIPSFLIITGITYAPHVIVGMFHKLETGAVSISTF